MTEVDLPLDEVDIGYGNTRWDPPVTVSVRLVSVVSDACSTTTEEPR